MRVPVFISALLFTFLLAACSSSGSGSLTPYSSPVAAPVLPTSAAFSTSTVVSPAASAAATSVALSLPPSSGYSGQATLPLASIPPNLHLTVTYSNGPPTGLSAFATVRQPSSQRHLLDALSTNVVYACLGVNESVDVRSAPHFTFTLPSGFATSGIAYYLAIAQNGKWTDGYSGPGTIVASATSATLSLAGRFGFVIPANGLVCTAVYARSTNAPTPVPATPAPTAVPATPTPTPTPTPSSSPSTPTPSPSPATLVVTAAPVAISGGTLALTVGATDTLTIAAPSAPATATTTCATGSVATLSGSGTVFVLTGTAIGACTITLTNASGATNSIHVTIAARPPLGVTAAPVASSGGGLALTVGTAGTLTVAAGDAPATASTTCGTGSVATLSGSGAAFLLTGTTVGNCAITLTNAAGKTNTISVTVALGPITFSPASLAFTSTGFSQSLTITEAGYAGTFTQTNTCSGVATVSPAGSTTTSASFNVTSVAAGLCAVVVTDAAGRSATSSVGVTTLGGSIR